MPARKLHITSSGKANIRYQPYKMNFWGSQYFTHEIDLRSPWEWTKTIFMVALGMFLYYILPSKTPFIYTKPIFDTCDADQHPLTIPAETLLGYHAKTVSSSGLIIWAMLSGSTVTCFITSVRVGADLRVIAAAGAIATLTIATLPLMLGSIVIT